MAQQDAPCCSRWKKLTKMPEHCTMAEHAETATSEMESETTTARSTQDEQNQSEMTNQTEKAGKQEQIEEKRKTALVSLKQTMPKRQSAERHKKAKLVQKQWIERNTIQSESENDEAEKQPEGERDDEEQQNEPSQQAEQEENNPIQKEETHNEKRRGNRNRIKPDYFGNSVMVTQVSPSSEDERESSPEY